MENETKKVINLFETPCDKAITEQEALVIEQNLVGFFNTLIIIDQRIKDENQRNTIHSH